MSLPLHGEYFVFELDPVTSIATFEDPIATKLEACEDMKNKHYLACIPQVSRSYSCSISLLTISEVPRWHPGRGLSMRAGHHAGLNSWTGRGPGGRHAT